MLDSKLVPGVLKDSLAQLAFGYHNFEYFSG